MNYVTTNTTGCIIHANTTCIYNPKSYIYSCNIIDKVSAKDILTCAYTNRALQEDAYRSEAVKAIYDRGYITRDEANSLIGERYAKRNECTTIYCVDNGAEIVIFCTESTSFLESETLFKFSYEKYSGKVTEETNDN